MSQGEEFDVFNQFPTEEIFGLVEFLIYLFWIHSWKSSAWSPTHDRVVLWRHISSSSSSRMEEGLDERGAMNQLPGVQGSQAMRPAPPVTRITTRPGSCHSGAQGTLVQAHQPIRGQYGPAIGQSEARVPAKNADGSPVSEGCIGCSAVCQTQSRLIYKS